jgi:hypothetical protein
MGLVLPGATLPDGLRQKTVPKPLNLVQRVLTCLTLGKGVPECCGCNGHHLFPTTREGLGSPGQQEQSLSEEILMALPDLLWTSLGSVEVGSGHCMDTSPDSSDSRSSQPGERFQ